MSTSIETEWLEVNAILSPSKFIIDIGKCNNEKGLGTFRGSIKVQQLFDLASLPNSCSYKLNRRKTETKWKKTPAYVHPNPCDHAESKSGSSEDRAQRRSEWPVSGPQCVRETRAHKCLLLLPNFNGFATSPFKFQTSKCGLGGDIPGRQGGHFVLSRQNHQ